MRVVTDKEIAILDQGSELFQDSVRADEILDMWFRGFYSDKELVERLSYLRMWSLGAAEKKITAPAEGETQEIFGDSGVA